MHVPDRSQGFSLLELLFVTAIVATLVTLSIPATTGAVDQLRTAMAARYLEGRIMHARTVAIRRSARVALRFEPAADDYRFGEYADGNGNGVRAAEIASGLDPELAAPQRLEHVFPGVAFGLLPGVPDVDGTLSLSTDGLRLGSSRILTLAPDGTASSGTLYIRGRRGQYAVRILGATGRTRMLRFHPGEGRWRTP